MKTLKLGIIVAFLPVAIAVPWLVQHRAQVNLRATNDTLRRQAGPLTQLLADNERLSNIVAKAKGSQSLSEAHLTELLKLRNEIGQLNWTLKGMELLQSEIHRMTDGLKDLAKDKERGGPSAATLLTDKLEQELRTRRVAQFKEWLKEAPAEEKTPELQFVPEDWWVRSADWPRVTDEEHQGWISMGRAMGELKFASMAFEVVKAFAKANDGRFPSDVSQLKPYFDSPIDDAILQRYHIAPANSLSKFFAEVGGDWVITQKEPVNAKFDLRISIGLTGVYAGPGRGSWDPAQ